ncbi:MAG: hypothetical protein QM729_03510 [Solirubrobacterales bacterium]
MALIALLLAAFGAGSAAAAFGVSKWEAGTCTVSTCTYSGSSSDFYTQAAGHPNDGITDFRFNATEILGVPISTEGNVENVRVDLPEGLNVNPTAVAWCTKAEFEADAAVNCADAQVGTSEITSIGGVTIPGIAVYDIEPEQGHPALFGFHVALLEANIYLQADIDWASDYHEGFTISEIPNSVPLVENKLVFAGQTGGSFLTVGSECDGPSTTSLVVRSYEDETVGPIEATPPAAISNCASVPFSPTVAASASGATDSSTTVSVSLEVPQHEGAEEVNTSTVKTADVTLPAYTGLNPATAPGLEFCKDEQFPLKSEAATSCPEKSQIGTIAIEAPELPAGSLTGPVYLAEQKSRDPQSGNEYRIFFNAESSRYGVQVREEGKVKANPTTGQLTAEFNELPQVAFSSATLTFGPQAKHAIPVLSSPPICTNTSTSTAVPYSTGTLTTTSTTELKLTSAPGGGACAKTMAERPFEPGFLAHPGTSKVLTYTPYQLQITRGEGQQEIKGFDITLPRGATAKLKGVPYCTATEFEAASSKSGAAEEKNASCSKESEIGVASILAGTGSSPLKIIGSVYLSGPYKGAPLSIVVITPAVAGPFDLGNVVVRAPLDLDPETGQVQASAEIPDVFGGVKLDIRSIFVNLNKKEFTLNGTNCKKGEVAGTVNGGGGDPTNSADWSSFDVSTPARGDGCKALKFKPGLKVRLFGQTHRAQHPKLKATLTTKKGQANVELASVALPHSIFLDQSSLGTICTRPQFTAEQCPKKSIYGHAIAYSPLLAKPLKGPVVLRSSNNTLPDMVADLRGQVDVVLDGKIDSYKGGIRTTFRRIPDLPVSKFVLVVKGGKHGLLQNSTNLCKQKVKGIIRLTAQNSRKSNRHVKIQTPCKAKKSHKSKGKK